MFTYILFILSCFLNLPICKRLRCAFDLHLRVHVPRLPQMPVSPNRRFVRECGSERGTRAPALVGERRRTLWPQCWKLRSEWIHRPLTTNKQCIEGSSNASVESSIKRAHTWSLSLWITLTRGEACRPRSLTSISLGIVKNFFSVWQCLSWLRNFLHYSWLLIKCMIKR